MQEKLKTDSFGTACDWVAQHFEDLKKGGLIRVKTFIPKSSQQFETIEYDSFWDTRFKIQFVRGSAEDGEIELELEQAREQTVGEEQPAHQAAA